MMKRGGTKYSIEFRKDFKIISLEFQINPNKTAGISKKQLIGNS